MTIDKWLKKMRKHSLFATVVRIEMPHEADRIKALEQIIAQTHVKAVSLEAVIAAVWG